MSKTKKLTIEFPTTEHRNTFIEWFSNSGEQYYWSGTVEIDPQNRPAVEFDYWSGTGERVWHHFVGTSGEDEVIIKTKPLDS